jgi:hypothetical protein
MSALVRNQGVGQDVGHWNGPPRPLDCCLNDAAYSCLLPLPACPLLLYSSGQSEQAMADRKQSGSGGGAVKSSARACAMILRGHHVDFVGG